MDNDHGITDELREWAQSDALRAGMSLRAARDQALAIADRIDAELAERYVELPKDADGEAVHPRDLMVSAKGHFDGCHEVKSLVLVKCDGDLSWSCQLAGVGAWDTYFALGNLRHYKQPTVEDTLHELIGKALMLSEIDGENELVAEYAKRLRLVGDAE